MARSGGSNTPKFVELLDFFERNIANMEIKIRELETDLQSGKLLTTGFH